MDQKVIKDRQVADLLMEFKNRIIPIQPYMGMPGAQGYSIKVNRIDINSTLEIYLTVRFPYEPPICMVKPSFQNEIVDNYGRISDVSLQQWNSNSTLRNCIKEILSKLELKTNNTNNIKNNIVDGIQNLNISNNIDEQIFTKDLTAELNKKSIEELIYINYNPEHFISEMTEQGKIANEQLMNEVKELNTTFETKKNEYEALKTNLNNYKKQYEEKEKNLNDLYNQKKALDSSMTVDKLIEEINLYINNNFQKPRQKLLNDYMNKSVESFDEFKDKYKDLSIKYHYYSIIRDKLNLCK